MAETPETRARAVQQQARDVAAVFAEIVGLRRESSSAAETAARALAKFEAEHALTLERAQAGVRALAVVAQAKLDAVLESLLPELVSGRSLAASAGDVLRARLESTPPELPDEPAGRLAQAREHAAQARDYADQAFAQPLTWTSRGWRSLTRHARSATRAARWSGARWRSPASRIARRRDGQGEVAARHA